MVCQSIVPPRDWKGIADLNRMSSFGTFVLWSFALFWMVKLIQYVVDIQRLRELQSFYFYLLEIRDVIPPPPLTADKTGRHPNHLLAASNTKADEVARCKSEYCKSHSNKVKCTFLQTADGCT